MTKDTFHKDTFHEDTATKDQPGRHREHEDGESSPLDLLLTPQCRITVLQSALDSLTLQIAHKKHLFNPGEKRVRLLQDQVRLIGSQIRSYEKLEQLKKDMGLAGTSLVAEEVARENMHAVEPVDAAVATGPEKKSATPAEPSPVIDEAIRPTGFPKKNSDMGGVNSSPMTMGEVAHADKHATEGDVDCFSQSTGLGAQLMNANSQSTGLAPKLANLTRAERRRLKRAESKRQKNKSALINGAKAPDLAGNPSNLDAAMAP